MQDHGAGRLPETVVVRARPWGTAVVFGSVSALWALALAAAESAQPTASGRVAAGAFFGTLLAASLGGWFAVNRRRRRLEVGREAIVIRPGAQGKPFTLTRGGGDTLRILPRFTMLGEIRPARLFLLGRGGFIVLRNFPLDEVRRACEAQGWRFDGDPALAVRDVQHWLSLGRSVEAARLIELFGPFPAAAADGDAHTGLEAAVFEDLGDKLARRARARARDAYRRAASAQRAFAGHAPSPEEAAQRMAGADRIDGKARY